MDKIKKATQLNLRFGKRLHKEELCNYLKSLFCQSTRSRLHELEEKQLYHLNILSVYNNLPGVKMYT